MQKILILGDGFIGSNLNRYFTKKYDTTILSKSILDVTYNKFDFDFSDFTTVIYAVGMKNVKECENHFYKCFDINSNGVSNVIKHLPKITKFIYISTDYVFDGTQSMYSELCNAKPATVYGYSKLLGEFLTKKHSNHIIVRTSGVYGKNCVWLNNLLHDLDKGQDINCYSDIYNSPTYVVNLSEMIDDLLEMNFAGTINLCGRDRCNRYELYSKVAEVFGKNRKLLHQDKSDGTFPKDVSLSHSLYSVRAKKTPNNISIGLKRLLNEN